MEQLERSYENITYFCTHSPVPIIAITLDGIIVGANDLANDILNKGKNLESASFYDFFQDRYHELIHHSTVHLQEMKQSPRLLEVKTLHKQWLKLHCRFLSENEASLILITLEDITWQKQRDLLLELNQTVLNMIVKRESLQEILHRLSTMVEAYFVRKAYSSILLINQDKKISKIVAPNLPHEFIAPFYDEEVGEKGSCGTAMVRKEPIITQDILTDPLWEGVRTHTVSYGLHSCWSIPIFIDEEVVGSFAIYHPYSSVPTQLELEMIEMCAKLVGLALERKEGEKRLLHETEKRFKFVMDLIPDLIVFKDEKGRWLEGNQTAKEKLPTFQFSQVGDESKPLYQQYQYFLSQVEETDQLVLELNSPVRRELKFPQTNGDELVYDIIKVPLISEDHILNKGIVVIGRDITERKKTERLLERNEQQFKSLFDHNPNGICIMDLNGEVVSCNHSLEQILGYEFSEIKNATYQFVNQSDLERAKEHFNQSLKGISQEFETTIRHQTGRNVYLKVTNVPIIVQENVIGVYGIVEDITEKIKSQEKLKQTKEFLESLIYHSADCIGTLSLDGEVLHVNPAIESIYGWKLEEIIGKKYPVLPDAQREEMNEIIEKIKAGKDIIGIETKRKKKDGSIIDVSITYSPLRDGAGNLIGFTSVSRDISDRKRTDELLKRSDKLSVIGQLSAAVAHEIRNPLTSIKGFIQLFSDRIQKEYADLMLSELERIEVIVTEFLSLAKPQANLFLEKDPVQILKDTLAIIDTEALLNQIEIECEIDRGIDAILCNEHKIKQVLINILKNAIESMPTGGKLKIKMKNSDPFVKIEVTDQGCGIPKEKMERLGEPFYSSKDHGTGLGLMVCFKIIEEHKGLIEIESEVGEGTTIMIHLPIYKEL
ncbi:PAS domain S-box protein [Alkalihalobacterium chitinilyticum]|uniref:histidine kinase n=1 Tax=Alkalihalobacterium chitinilyticum TaxID=2980103 RepID=A0ABT5VDI2_9BACI|nr:PAS domain S-box protein [Alkalihalobacterium chitinilyticum]MDE5413513.1 PAS domain S-box protein [Alkalihalobacterium chitinilyticum]